MDRAGSIGLHVGPVRLGSKNEENVEDKRHLFQEVLFETLFLKK